MIKLSKIHTFIHLVSQPVSSSSSNDLTNKWNNKIGKEILVFFLLEITKNRTHDNVFMIYVYLDLSLLLLLLLLFGSRKKY